MRLAPDDATIIGRSTAQILRKDDNRGVLGLVPIP